MTFQNTKLGNTATVVQTSSLTTISAATSITYSLTNAPAANGGVLFIMISDDEANLAPTIVPIGATLITNITNTTFAPLFGTRVYWLPGGKSGGRNSWTFYLTGSTTAYGWAFEMSGCVGEVGASDTVNSRVTATPWSASTTEFGVPAPNSTRMTIQTLAAAASANLGSITASTWTTNAKSRVVTAGSTAFNATGGVATTAVDIQTTAADNWTTETYAFSGTKPNATSNPYVQIMLHFLPMGRSWVNGYEFGETVTPSVVRNIVTNHGGGIGGVYDTTSKRPASTGTYGGDYTATLGDGWLLPFMSTHLKLQGYANVHSSSETTLKRPLLGFMGRITEGSASTVAQKNMWWVGWNSNTNKICAHVEDDAAGNTQDVDGPSYTKDTWVKINIEIYINSSAQWVMNWWVDGVAQTSITISQPTTGTANYWWPGSVFACLPVSGYVGGAATVTYVDDIYVVGDSTWVATWPDSDRSVVGFWADGRGTDVTATDLQETDGTAIDANSHQWINDSVITAGSPAGIQTKAAGAYASYVEFTMANPGKAGVFCFWNLYVAASQMDLNETWVHIGSEDHYVGNSWIGYSHNGTQSWAITANTQSNPGATGNNTPGSHATGSCVGIDPKDNSGTMWTSSQIDALTVRFGKNNGSTHGIAGMRMQHVEIGQEVFGSDHWGWAEGADAMDSWQLVTS